MVPEPPQERFASPPPEPTLKLNTLENQGLKAWTDLVKSERATGSLSGLSNAQKGNIQIGILTDFLEQRLDSNLHVYQH